MDLFPPGNPSYGPVAQGIGGNDPAAMAMTSGVLLGLSGRHEVCPPPTSGFSGPESRTNLGPGDRNSWRVPAGSLIYTLGEATQPRTRPGTPKRGAEVAGAGRMKSLRDEPSLDREFEQCVSTHPVESPSA